MQRLVLHADDALAGDEHLVEGHDRLNLFTTGIEGVVLGSCVRVVHHLAAVHAEVFCIRRDDDPETLLVPRRMETTDDQLVRLWHGRCDALDARDPDSRGVFPEDRRSGPLERYLRVGGT